MTETFQAWIQGRWKRSGLSYTALARRLDISPNTLIGWIEVGRRPKPEQLLRVAAGLHVDEDYLLELAGYLRSLPRPAHEEDDDARPMTIDEMLRCALDLGETLAALPPAQYAEVVGNYAGSYRTQMILSTCFAAFTMATDEGPVSAQHSRITQVTNHNPDTRTHGAG